jgi:hypothetical protein
MSEAKSHYLTRSEKHRQDKRRNQPLHRCAKISTRQIFLAITNTIMAVMGLVAGKQQISQPLLAIQPPNY